MIRMEKTEYLGEEINRYDGPNRILVNSVLWENQSDYDYVGKIKY